MEGRAGEDDAGGAAAGDAAVDAPLVFQCRKCLQILGDSFSWVTSDPLLKTVTLSGAADGVQASGIFETSNRDRDLGSTYHALLCQCGERVGRIYKTTARELDAIRDMCTFDIDAISSYKLGTAGVLGAEDVLDFPSASAMKVDIHKIQQLLLVMNDRLLAIEGGSGGSSQSDGARRVTKRAKKS